MLAQMLKICRCLKLGRRGVSIMNVQQARFRDTPVDQTSEQFIPDRSSFPQRTAAVVAAASAEAEAVDRDARFPKAAIDAARSQKLLGIQIPIAFGGDGAPVAHATHMCSPLRPAPGSPPRYSGR